MVGELQNPGHSIHSWVWYALQPKCPEGIRLSVSFGGAGQCSAQGARAPAPTWPATRAAADASNPLCQAPIALNSPLARQGRSAACRAQAVHAVEAPRAPVLGWRLHGDHLGLQLPKPSVAPLGARWRASRPPHHQPDLRRGKRVTNMTGRVLSLKRWKRTTREADSSASEQVIDCSGLGDDTAECATSLGTECADEGEEARRPIKHLLPPSTAAVGRCSALLYPARALTGRSPLRRALPPPRSNPTLVCC